MGMDLENMLNFIDDYYFTNEKEKGQYASKLVTLLADGVELNNSLTRMEANRKKIFTNRISQRFPYSTMTHPLRLTKEGKLNANLLKSEQEARLLQLKHSTSSAV
ncbi:hypothetical protein TNCT_663351 [Trichonephila clavata]|uniref:Uncharacterized protein n=1 Tax=Trichonephila clavata TaxID=2740835 RepID=A0A8X6KUV4_TRICU|nr:hypothetical protein TNCT_663351 [Trichonephila clavata]